MKLHSSGVSGSLALFERENTFTTKLCVPCLAAVKFTLQIDKGKGKFYWLSALVITNNSTLTQTHPLSPTLVCGLP